MPSSPAMDLWTAEAQALDTYRDAHVPLDVLIGESVDVARFVREFWDPDGARPGLSLAGAKLPSTIADDVISLREALQDAQTTYRLAIMPRETHQEALARAGHVLAELKATLEWHFDDGVDDEVDAQLQTLAAIHNDNTNAADRLAQALHDYATLAQPHAQDLQGLGGFDAALIDEAFDLSRMLGEVQQSPTAGGKEAQAAIELRDRFAHLLQQRVALVRRATRFVFRGYPQVIRRATSAYERRQRAARRRAQQRREQGMD